MQPEHVQQNLVWITGLADPGRRGGELAPVRAHGGKHLEKAATVLLKSGRQGEAADTGDAVVIQPLGRRQRARNEHPVRLIADAQRGHGSAT